MNANVQLYLAPIPIIVRRIKWNLCQLPAILLITEHVTLLLEAAISSRLRYTGTAFVFDDYTFTKYTEATSPEHKLNTTRSTTIKLLIGMVRIQWFPTIDAATCYLVGN